MIVTCVYVHVKPGLSEKFIKLTVDNCRESVKEPGNLRFDLIKQADSVNHFMVYEAYESEEAAAAHKSTNHYLKWREAVQDMMEEPRKGVRYNIVEPNDKTKW